MKRRNDPRAQRPQAGHRFAYLRMFLTAFLMLLCGAALVAVAILRIRHWALKLLFFVAAAVLLTIGLLFMLSIVLTLRMYRKMRKAQKARMRTFGNVMEAYPAADNGENAGAESPKGRAERVNFFLYDPCARTNISPEELDVEAVSEKMLAYINSFAKHGRLDIALLFDTDRPSAVPRAFRPLCVYRLLLKLCQDDNEGIWKSFLSCGKSMVDTFSESLPEGEDWLGRQLQKSVALYTNGKDPDAAMRSFRAFVMGKREWLSERMLSYVREHLHEFE